MGMNPPKTFLHREEAERLLAKGTEVNSEASRQGAKMAVEQQQALLSIAGNLIAAAHVHALLSRD